MAATTAEAHKHPNYMTIFWWLAALTVIELLVIFLPLAKFTIGVLLVGLALGKAALVAMYFMHLRFETKTLGWIAVTPLAIATLLVFVLLPDGFAVAKKTDDSKKVAPAAASKHGARRPRERFPCPPGRRCIASRRGCGARRGCAARAAAGRRCSAAGSR